MTVAQQSVVFRLPFLLLGMLLCNTYLLGG